jgi:hypothetical protein
MKIIRNITSTNNEVKLYCHWYSELQIVFELSSFTRLSEYFPTFGVQKSPILTRVGFTKLLQQILRFFRLKRSFIKWLFIENRYFMIYAVANISLSASSASKSTSSLYNLKILRPKVRKNITNLPKKFYRSPSSFFTINNGFSQYFRVYHYFFIISMA